MTTTAIQAPELEGMTVQEILQHLYTQGYGAKKLSHALSGAIGYKSLHRWRLGQYSPRNPGHRDLLIRFARSLGHTVRSEYDDTDSPI